MSTRRPFRNRLFRPVVVLMVAGLLCGVGVIVMGVHLGGIGNRGEGVLRGVAEGALRIATYNLNFERISPETLDAVRTLDVDVVVLQETHPDWESALRETALPWDQIYFQHSGRDGGMAILSRYPVREMAWMPSQTGPFPAWHFELDVGEVTLDVLAVHLHPPLDERGLLTGYFTTAGLRRAELREHLDRLPRLPDLVLGDFNEMEGGSTAEMDARGLQSVQHAYPPVEPTWKWALDWVTLTGRPDHIFYGTRLRNTGAQVPLVGQSDHWPLWAVFEVVP